MNEVTKTSSPYGGFFLTIYGFHVSVTPVEKINNEWHLSSSLSIEFPYRKSSYGSEKYTITQDYVISENECVWGFVFGITSGTWMRKFFVDKTRELDESEMYDYVMFQMNRKSIGIVSNTKGTRPNYVLFVNCCENGWKVNNVDGWIVRIDQNNQNSKSMRLPIGMTEMTNGVASQFQNIDRYKHRNKVLQKYYGEHSSYYMYQLDLGYDIANSIRDIIKYHNY